MRTFLLEDLLPLVVVVAGIIVSTLVLFGPPTRIKDASIAATAGLTPTNAESAKRMDAAMSRAIDALRAARRQSDVGLPPPRAPRTTKAIATSASSKGAADPGANLPGAAPAATISEKQSASLLSAVSSLTDAVKAVREARTEEDFVRAEDRMRAAREQMQSACASGVNGAFCESAKEMGSLGF